MINFNFTSGTGRLRDRYPPLETVFETPGYFTTKDTRKMRRMKEWRNDWMDLWTDVIRSNLHLGTSCMSQAPVLGISRQRKTVQRFYITRDGHPIKVDSWKMLAVCQVAVRTGPVLVQRDVDRTETHQPLLFVRTYCKARTRDGAQETCY